MGASVGIGSMIVGISLLTIFVLAVQTLDYQVESSLEELDEAGEPIPSIKVNDANIDANTISAIAITDGGTGYTSGTLSAKHMDSISVNVPGDGYTTGGNLDFSSSTCDENPVGTYTSDGDAIDGVSISNWGDGCDSISVNADDDNGGGVDAAFTVTLGKDKGFSATYTVNGGAIDTITITNYGVGFEIADGNDIKLTASTGPAWNSADRAVLAITKGNAFFMNLTNTGSTTLDLGKIWFSLDGEDPERISAHHTTTGKLFPGEKLDFDFGEGSGDSISRVSVTAMGVIAASSVD